MTSAEVDPFAPGLAELLPEEAAALSRASEERRLEYRAGRHCARVALARLGVHGAVLRSADRSPVWPPGVVGSITHTRGAGTGFCGAVAARASEVRALGVDAEWDDPLEPALFRRVLTEREAVALSALPEDERGRAAKLVFSAKESAYKCQYPLSRQFLEFGDVEVSLDGDPGTFTARFLRPAGPFGRGDVLAGRFVREARLVVTGVMLR